MDARLIPDADWHFKNADANRMYAIQAGVKWQPYQEEALTEIALQGPPQRLLLYYRTGGGKTLTALACLRRCGYQTALVIAPPSTHAQWHAEAARLSVQVEVVSHAKFRMRDFKLKRDKPIIADEFHMFGGNTAVGFKKLDRAAANLTAPIILCSATPNYNDAERCYCVQHILDPASCVGGYLHFLNVHCKTRLNPFSATPYVDGFIHFASAADYLASLKQTVYVPETHVATIEDIEYPVDLPEAFDKFNFDERTGRIMTSIIQRRWSRQFYGLLTKDEELVDIVQERLIEIAGNATGPLIIFAVSKRVIAALDEMLKKANVTYCRVTGNETTSQKSQMIADFRTGHFDVLIGTAALATGTDGLDKVCDTLVILQDTDDDALRRQLIGRIMPRGTDTDASNKQVFRFVPVE